MPRWEWSLATLLIGIATPVTTGISFWWLTAAIAMYGLWPLSESAIAASAFVGLAVGIMLDILALKRWVRRFYLAKSRTMALLYLAWSVIALALLMGLPIGVLVLGACAGFYVGRKAHHRMASQAALERSARKAALFTAGVIAFESIVMGLLALHDRFTMTWILSRLGLAALAGSPWAEAGLLVAGCLALTLVQCGLTEKAAMRAYRIGLDSSTGARLRPPKRSCTISP